MKRSLKGLLGETLIRSGLAGRLTGDRALILTFHRVDDRLPGNPISCSRQQFVQICSFLAQHFEVVPLPHLVDSLNAGASLRNQVAITFDDGYLDNFTVAAPILSELGLPATFFVSTGFVGTRKIPPWDREAGVDSEWMDWPQLRQLHGAGFEIGAHTVTHPELTEVSASVARSEILESKLRLENELGSGVDFFAYPFGRQLDEPSTLRLLLEELGFLGAASCFGGWVSPGDDPLSLHRIPVSGWYKTPEQLVAEVLIDIYREKFGWAPNSPAFRDLS